MPEVNTIPDDQNAAVCKGVLLIPFSSKLGRLERWVIKAAERANVSLTPIKDSFDANTDIVSHIYNSIQKADIVVSVLSGANPNVLFESGYSVGWERPILYIAHQESLVPFDVGVVERFIYKALNEKQSLKLTAAIQKCIEASGRKPSASRAFVQLHQHLNQMRLTGGLFEECVHSTVARLSNWIQGWTNNIEFTGAHSILEVGTHLLRCLRKSGFVTLYYPGQESWEPDDDLSTPDDYFTATRDAVSRGCNIIRVYVVNTREQTDEPAFRRMVGADTAAGIETRVILANRLPEAGASDFGLWDDALFAEVEYTTSASQQPRLHRARYWADPASLEKARRWRENILAASSACSPLPSDSELLRKTIAVRSSIREEFCKRSGNGKENCSWYHLSWPYLRSLGLVSTPSWHRDFYATSFHKWSVAMGTKPALNILVCGLADYAMLYWVVQSLTSNLRDRCTFHVLDLCETPLEACSWLAQQLERNTPSVTLKLQQHQKSILDSGFESAYFDLITTDAFITRFETSKEKQDVLAEWTRLLRKGGYLVTTARVQNDAGDILEQHREEFIDRASERLANTGLSDAPHETIEQMVNAYANKIQSFPLESRNDLQKLLGRFAPTLIADFQIVSLEEVFEMAPAKYARICARKTDEP